MNTSCNDIMSLGDFSLEYATAQVPDNPSDPYYLKNCFVCSAKSKPGVEFIHNYGGLVCFSCRAFWRRAHRKTTNPEFSCKYGDQCILTIDNRSQCRSCRYKRCKLAGMTPATIMTEEQKKIRFRKMFEKRQKLATSKKEGKGKRFSGGWYGSSASASSSEEQSPCGEKSFGLMNDEMDIDLYGLVDNFSKEDFLPTILDAEPAVEAEKVASPHLSVQSCSILKKRVDTIATFYDITLASKEIFKTWLPSTKDELWNHLISVTEEFKNFAHCQKQFCQLSQVAKNHLIFYNTQMFVQFHLVCNLTATPELPMKYNYLEKLASLLSVLNVQADLDEYTRLIDELSNYTENASFNDQAAMAYFILFSYSPDQNTIPSGDLSDLEEVYVMNETMFDCEVKKRKEHNFEQFLQILMKMARFFNENF